MKMMSVDTLTYWLSLWCCFSWGVFPAVYRILWKPLQKPSQRGAMPFLSHFGENLHAISAVQLCGSLWCSSVYRGWCFNQPSYLARACDLVVISVCVPGAVSGCRRPWGNFVVTNLLPTWKSSLRQPQPHLPISLGDTGSPAYDACGPRSAHPVRMSLHPPRPHTLCWFVWAQGK